MKMSWVILLSISVSLSVFAVLHQMSDNDSVISEDTISNFADIGITKLSIEFKGAEIILKAVPNIPMSCSDLIEKLAISDISLDNKVYTHSCSKLKSSLIVTYKKSE